MKAHILTPRKVMTTFLLLLFFGTSFSQSPCKEIVGYYPNWQWYDRAQLVNPQTLDYSKYTIINYCFFAPQPDGTINTTDAWADENLLLGQPDWVNGGYLPNTSIVDLAHANGIEILPSIGGWTLSTNFPSIAASPALRATFAQSCVNLIQTYNFDGIDLDWEYPGYAPHGGTPQDFTNFTLLLQEIRTAIDNYGQSIGKTMQLTVAVGAGPDRMADVDWPAVNPLLDIINLMSYDFFGAWDATTNHNAPLTAPAQGDPTFNLTYSVNALTGTYGIPSSKITAGIAFYGRSSITSGTPGLHTPNAGGTDGTTFWQDDGSPLYYNIMANYSQFTEHWDATAQVPYLTGNNMNTFVSYDNEQSIGLKAEFIVDNNLRGAIIWEITGDYMETSPGSGMIAGTPLADTLNNVFCNYIGAGNPPNVTVSGNLTLCEGESITLTASGADSYVWNTGATVASITVSPATSTTYTVTGTNSFGTDTETINVTVYPLPAAPSIVNNNGNLNAQSPGNTYQWFLNGVIINGATMETYTPTQTGDYTVEVTNPNGCSILSLLYTFGAPPTVNINGNLSICLGDDVTLTANGADSYVWSTGETTQSVTYTPTTTTSYSVTGSNPFGSDTTTVTVVINQPPSTPSVIDNSGILESSINGVTYQWYFNSLAISGAIANTHVPTQDGNYSVEVFDANGCSATSSDFIWETIGLSEHTITRKYYPNPIQHSFIIEQRSALELTIVLFDLTGKRVHQFPLNNNSKIILDFATLAISKGSYLLHLTTKEGDMEIIPVYLNK
ncbi:MAG: glycosyl hydrolase family 18 protein [Crocinitomicaceae bacterium]|nr:glycosyl hydrolase family 18 protein [Crocinitomicaceae bacterium]